MSDFLSPAINERLKEKRMGTITISDFREKLLYLLKGKDTISNVTDLDDLAVYEMIYGKKAGAITKFFLDTIEKAKPDKVSNSNERGIGFNLALKEFDRGLKKEIGK